MPRWFEPLAQLFPTTGAQWIWPPDTHNPQARGRTDLALFHHSLQIPPETVRVELLVSAEGRYAFWIDTQPDAFGRGPARSDPFHRQLDAYDILFDPGSAPPSFHLWAQVRWFAGMPEAPMGESFSAQPAFFLLARCFDERNQLLSADATNSQWHSFRSFGISPQPLVTTPGFFCIGQSEIHHASGWPASSRSASPSFEQWVPAHTLGTPHFKHDPTVPWSPNGGSWLIERQIPHVESIPLPIRHIRVRQNQTDSPLEVAHGFRLAPHQTAILRCDLGAQANAHVRLALAGQGSSAALTYAEVLVDPATDEKSFSLDSPFPLRGFADHVHLDVHSFTFETHHWRAFRFLEISLTAGPAGAEIQKLELLATGYPFDPDFHLEVQGPLQDELRKIIDVSWRTLKCCTHETYMDCPFYEQMQYIGDSRIQALITYVTTADPFLPAQALRAFDRSRIYEGITASRAPGTAPQYIPTFSLIYILMIEDYLTHVGDDALVAELRPGIAPILNWFTRFMDPESSLIALVDYWPFVDWVQGWDKGIPPHAPSSPLNASGTSASVNLLYLLALQAAARIYDAAKPGSGNFYAVRATALKQKIYDAFFDASRGLIRDVPLYAGRGKQNVWSQHAQALAILADVLTATEARAALEKSLDPCFILSGGDRKSAGFPRVGENDPRFISPASFYFRFYVAEAIAKLRMGHLFWPLMQPFREALARGSTVWPESFEPSRSECHAWSSWPLYFFARHLLGITPPSPEDQRIRIRPLHCPPLESLEGRFQTYKGPVDVLLDWPADRNLKATGPNIQILDP